MKDIISEIGLDLLSGVDPHDVMLRLARTVAERTVADRCTLTSLDQAVMRVEASYETGGQPVFVGREFSMDYLPDQPLLQEAVTSRRIVTGGSLAANARVEPELRSTLTTMKRTAIIPLQLGGELVAVLVLSRKADLPFDSAELDEMQQLGMLAVLALRNARLLEEVQRGQMRGLETLTLMSQHIASSDAPAAFFGKMSETVAGLVQAERAVYWRIAKGKLVAQPEAWGFTLEALHRPDVAVPAPGEGRFADLLYAGAALRHSAPEGEPRTLEDRLLRDLGVRDQLAVPWRTAQGPIGILAAYDSRRGFTEQDEWIMRLAARASALVWQGYEAEQRAQQLQEEERMRLQAHATAMAELERQKSEFLQIASHELRTPITLVMGYLSMLEDQTLGELPPAAANVVPLLSSRMAQMNELVDRLLRASRMQEGGFGAEPADVNVDQIVRSVAASLDGVGPHPRRVTVDSPRDVVVRADAEKVETIVNNLVSNAIKYSPQGDDVHITVRAEPSWIAVAVADSGIGIDEADVRKLFQPFSRVDNAQTSSIEGTGLGLYLSRNLALLQGGDIQVQSTPGQGSTFTLRLPRNVREASNVDS